jgi:hypothetical protein
MAYSVRRRLLPPKLDEMPQRGRLSRRGFGLLGTEDGRQCSSYSSGSSSTRATTPPWPPVRSCAHWGATIPSRHARTCPCPARRRGRRFWASRPCCRPPSTRTSARCTQPTEERSQYKLVAQLGAPAARRRLLPLSVLSASTGRWWGRGNSSFAPDTKPVIHRCARGATPPVSSASPMDARDSLYNARLW